LSDDHELLEADRRGSDANPRVIREVVKVGELPRKAIRKMAHIKKGASFIKPDQSHISWPDMSWHPLAVMVVPEYP